jgi:pSer/pThr/pTyr-binding forkhead associated (FHA) protein
MGLLLTYLWRDTASTRRHPVGPQHARLDLVERGVVTESFPLAPVNTLGRAISNTIRLADNTVSAQHAEIRFSGDRWWLEDVGSSNGTVLNGEVIEAKVALSGGDRIEMGNTRLRLYLAPIPVSASESSQSADGREGEILTKGEEASR